MGGHSGMKRKCSELSPGTPGSCNKKSKSNVSSAAEMDGPDEEVTKQNSEQKCNKEKDIADKECGDAEHLDLGVSISFMFLQNLNVLYISHCCNL